MKPSGGFLKVKGYYMHSLYGRTISNYKGSVSETMECLGLSEANVKVGLNRAKVMLRDKLKAYLKDDEMLHLYKTPCDRMVDNVMGRIINEMKTGLLTNILLTNKGKL
jgi:hypothetical protein